MAAFVLAQRGFFRIAPCRFDLDELRPRGNLPVNVGDHFQLEARCVKTLVTLNVCEKAGVISAATGGS